MAKSTPKNRGGRPPAGPNGEEVRLYRHQFATRVSGDVFHLARSIKNVTGRPYRAILSDALTLYLAQRVTRADRQLIEETAAAARRNCLDCRAEQASRKVTR